MSISLEVSISTLRSLADDLRTDIEQLEDRLRMVSHDVDLVTADDRNCLFEDGDAALVGMIMGWNMVRNRLDRS